MCLPRNWAPFLAAISRQRWRLAATSRMPTVICVGRRSLMATVVRVGSRTILRSSSKGLIRQYRHQCESKIKAPERVAVHNREWQFPAAQVKITSCAGWGGRQLGIVLATALLAAAPQNVR